VSLLLGLAVPLFHLDFASSFKNMRENRSREKSGTFRGTILRDFGLGIPLFASERIEGDSWLNF